MGYKHSDAGSHQRCWKRVTKPARLFTIECNASGRCCTDYNYYNIYEFHNVYNCCTVYDFYDFGSIGRRRR